MTASARVVLAAPTWGVSGVNTFSLHLARGLDGRGLEAEILQTTPWKPDAKPLPRPEDVRFRRLRGGGRNASRRGRWRALRRRLERAAPCVYLPNHDFHCSAVVPSLGAGVRVVTVLHSDDDEYYELAERLGSASDAVVCVSRRIRERALARCPWLEAKTHLIPYGTPAPATPPEKATAGPLTLLYAGRLEERQKRVSVLPTVAHALRQRGLDFVLEIVGAGPEEVSLRAALAEAVHSGHVVFRGVLSPDETRRRMQAAHVLLSVSAFEGLPLSVLEGMAAGCVPVVTSVDSGVGELIEDGVHGIRVPVDAPAQMVEALEALARDRASLAGLASAAHARVRREFSVERMVTAYAELMEAALARPCARARRLPPRPHPSETWRDALPPRAFWWMRRARRRPWGSG